jgi:hypothetical protein
MGHMPFRRKRSETDNCSAKHFLHAPSSPRDALDFPPLRFQGPRPVQRLQPLDPTAHRPLHVAPQAGLWPEPTRGRTLAATPCGGRHPWPPQKLATGSPPAHDERQEGEDSPQTRSGNLEAPGASCAGMCRAPPMSTSFPLVTPPGRQRDQGHADSEPHLHSPLSGLWPYPSEAHKFGQVDAERRPHGMPLPLAIAGIVCSVRPRFNGCVIAGG